MDDDSRLIPPDQLADALHFDSTMVTDLTGATIGQAGRIKVNEGVSVVTYNYKTGLGAPGAELKMPVTLEINQGYTVSFNVGAYGYRVPDQKVAKGGTAREPKDPTDPYPTDPEEKNWEFKGWYTDNTFATAFDFSKPIYADTTVYAKWEKKSYTVSFDMGDHGDQVADQKVAKDEQASAPAAPTAKGWEFKGCLLYTSPSPRDKRQSRMPSSA